MLCNNKEGNVAADGYLDGARDGYLLARYEAAKTMASEWAWVCKGCGSPHSGLGVGWCVCSPRLTDDVVADVMRRLARNGFWGNGGQEHAAG